MCTAAMAEWLIGGTLSVCDGGRVLNRGEVVRLKMNMKEARLPR